MITDLRTITHDPHRFDLIFEQDWWRENEKNGQILGLNGDLACHMDIFRAGARHVLEGSLSGSIFLRCDRCLEPFLRELNFEFILFLASHLSSPDKSEIELSEDDMWVHLVEGNEVDLNDIVREQIYLSLPMKTLCREDCSGLCPVCGISLNVETCECLGGKGHPGFLKLKALKLKK